MVTAAVADPVAEAVSAAVDGCEVRLRLDRPITDQHLFELARCFDGVRFEVDRRGELVISGAAGGYSGSIEAVLLAQIIAWIQAIGGGIASGSSSGYHPPGGWQMVPDGSWMSEAAHVALQRLGVDGWRRGYFRVAPDFVFEVRSPSQDLEKQREKMEDWAAMNVRLGMLIDPETQTVWLYRPEGDGFAVEEFAQPSRVSCEPEMPGLELEFGQVWGFPWVE